MGAVMIAGEPAERGREDMSTGIFDDVTEEGRVQVAKGRDAVHDDARTAQGWIDCFEILTGEVASASGPERRRKLVKLARAAVSAIEAHDRANGMPACLSAADKAVLHALDQVQRNADVGHVIGLGTQAFDLLCTAEAMRTGEPAEKVRTRRSISLVTPTAKGSRRPKGRGR